jgi:apolipoprotein N-acyltransferase
MLALIAGVGLGLVQATWSIPSAFLFLPIIFWLHAGADKRRRAALLGWHFGLGYFGLTLSWIVEPFLIDVARHGWMAAFALFFMAGGLAAFWSMAFALAHRRRSLTLVIWWTLAEFARSVLFTGFPWALLAYGWVETPLIQITSVVGVHGLGLLTMIVAVMISRLNIRGIVGGMVIVSVLWTFGSNRLSQGTFLRTDGYTVRIIQPNAPQDQKWLPEFQLMFFERQVAFTAAEPTVDMVIWPEAAVPFFPQERLDLLERIARSANGANVLMGARRRDLADDWFNGLVVIDPTGAIISSYDKHHLVPFGEYVPMQSVLSRTGLTELTGRGFATGRGARVIDAGGVPPFLPLICYEAIFPQHASVDGQRPDWIIQITNDAWFGDLSGPYQHLAQSRVRAIEQGLPLARSANTGISAMIDPFGRITASMGLGEMGGIDVALPAPLKPTVFSRFGDLPAGVLLMLLIIYQLFSRSKRLYRYSGS